MNGTDRGADEKPTQVRWLIFLLACATSWLLYLHRYSWGVIKPAFKQEYPDITDTELGWLDSAFNVAYALGQVPGGLAGDFFGARVVLSVIILLWSATVAAVAWNGSYLRLYNVRLAFGLTQAGAYPVLSKLTRSWFPAGYRTSLQGVMTALGRIGAACAPLIIATFLMGVLQLPWRTCLCVIAAPGILLAVAFWLFVRNSPREHPWCDEAERDLLDPGAAHVAGSKEDRVPWTRGSAFNLAMLLIYAFASTFQDQLYVYWIPLFLTEGRGLKLEEMGLFTPLPLVGGALGGIVGGMLNDYLLRKMSNRRWARSSIAITGKFMKGVLVLVSLQAGDGRVAMVILLAARFFGDWSLSTLWGTLTDMGGRASGTIFGIVNGAGAVGGFVAGPCLGFLKQEYGWRGLFLGVAGMCFVSAVCWLFIDCRRRLVAD